MAAENDKKTNTMAILGLIFAFVFPILGLIFSIIAKGQIKKTGENGSGLALAGLIISIIAIVVYVIIIIVSIVAASTAVNVLNESTDYYNNYYDLLNQ